jgi:hypothetical protein
MLPHRLSSVATAQMCTAFILIDKYCAALQVVYNAGEWEALMELYL